MFTQLHIMPDSCIYSRTELNGIHFTVFDRSRVFVTLLNLLARFEKTVAARLPEP